MDNKPTPKESLEEIVKREVAAAEARMMERDEYAYGDDCVDDAEYLNSLAKSFNLGEGLKGEIEVLNAVFDIERKRAESKVYQIDPTWKHRPTKTEAGEEIEYIKLGKPVVTDEFKEEKQILEYCPEDDPQQNILPQEKYRREPVFKETLSAKECISRWEKVEKVAKDENIAQKYSLPKSVCSTQDDIQGILVFYINVGQLAPDKAEAFCERTMEKAKPVTDKVKAQGWEILYMPTRQGETRIEQLFFGDLYFGSA